MISFFVKIANRVVRDDGQLSKWPDPSGVVSVEAMAQMTADPSAHAMTPTRSHWVAVGVAVAWVLVTWTGRIRNVAASNSWSEDRLSVLMAISFVVVGLLVVGACLFYFTRRTDRTAATVAITWTLVVLAGWSICIWVARIIGISLNSEHEIGFKIVHALLGVIAISTSSWAASKFWKLTHPTI